MSPGRENETDLIAVSQTLYLGADVHASQNNPAGKKIAPAMTKPKHVSQCLVFVREDGEGGDIRGTSRSSGSTFPCHIPLRCLPAPASATSLR